MQNIKKNPLLLSIVNKQFEILGVKLKFEDIPENGVIEVNKTKDYWYNIYKFNVEQEEEWRLFMREKLKGMDKKEALFNYIDLRYGLPLAYKKEGLLF